MHILTYAHQNMCVEHMCRAYLTCLCLCLQEESQRFEVQMQDLCQQLDTQVADSLGDIYVCVCARACTYMHT